VIPRYLSLRVTKLLLKVEFIFLFLHLLVLLPGGCTKEENGRQELNLSRTVWNYHGSYILSVEPVLVSKVATWTATAATTTAQGRHVSSHAWLFLLRGGQFWRRPELRWLRSWSRRKLARGRFRRFHAAASTAGFPSHIPRFFLMIFLELHCLKFSSDWFFLLLNFFH
jgi:hypothetical protein